MWLKYDGANPTGSFKDRGMTMAISKAAEAGAKAVICASTGNTSASAAAYAAKAGMTCAVLVPQGKIAMGKLAQAIVHGARLLQVDGNFDDCLELARELADDYPVALVNSVNPSRIEGQKTAAFEIVDRSAARPTSTACRSATPATSPPTGRATSSTRPTASRRRGPRMWGFQAAGAAPLVSGEPVAHPETIATAIRIGNPASWQQADRRPRRVRRAHRRGDRRRDPRGVPPARARRGAVLRAGLRRQRRRPAQDARGRCARSRPGGRRAPSPATASRTPQWALAGAAEPVVVPVDAAAAAHALGLA